jgi:uncharacterized protein (TIGR03435 family)
LTLDAVLIGVLGFLSLSLLAQAPPAGNLSFEVASIKPGDPDTNHVGIHVQPGGRFNTTNTSLRILLQYAYDIYGDQITAGPGWLDTVTFTIEAKPDSETRVPAGPESNVKVMSMVRSLLADRFKLIVHWETRDAPVYELVVAKGGPKMRETDANYPGHDVNRDGSQLTAKGVPMSMLIRNLSRQLGRPVIDKTGLTGNYDFQLTYTPESREGVFGRPQSSDAPIAADPNVTSIFTALPEQIGLKLQSAKGPVQILVIDHAEKPSVN